MRKWFIHFEKRIRSQTNPAFSRHSHLYSNIYKKDVPAIVFTWKNPCFCHSHNDAPHFWLTDKEKDRQGLIINHAENINNQWSILNADPILPVKRICCETHRYTTVQIRLLWSPGQCRHHNPITLTCQGLGHIRGATDLEVIDATQTGGKVRSDNTITQSADTWKTCFGKHLHLSMSGYSFQLDLLIKKEFSSIDLLIRITPRKN